MAIDIFLNYRSVDEPYAALLIDRCLTDRFGPGRVFWDGRTIPAGTYFPRQIRQALQQCRALIAIIGSRWLAQGPDGQLLIDDPRDYVRREIAVALRRDILVVPVLVEDASLPAAAVLPTDVSELASRQYLHLRTRSAKSDASRLVDALAVVLDGPSGPAAPEPAPPQPGGAGSRYTFRGPVDARYSVLGTVYQAGRPS